MPKNKEMPKKRKARKKKAIAISLIGVLTAGGVGGTVYYQQNSKVKMPAETKKAQSATAELGSISNTIVGTGNLDYLRNDSPLVIPAIFLLLFWTNLSIDVDILRMIKLNWKIYL